jgi:NAD+ diphosphatase
MTHYPHTFSGNRLDRAERERRDPAWIERRERDPASVFLPLRRLDVLVRETTATRLDWRTSRWLSEMRVDGPRYLLGLWRGVAHFAVDVSDHPDDLDQDREQRFAELRAAAALLPTDEAGIAAQARANVDWHARHRFCGVCGHPTEPQRGGQSRRCGHCGAEHFPRTDPVVIVVVSDGDRCLLGQSRGRLASQRMFSALAGFMDQGETIEEAVRREVAEEAGVAPVESAERIRRLKTELAQARRQVAAAERAEARRSASALLADREQVDGLTLVAGQVNVANRDALRQVSDSLRDQLEEPWVILLATSVAAKPAFVAAASAQAVDAGVHAGDLARTVAKLTGGGGGGRPELAMSGGTDAAKIDEALDAGRSYVAAIRRPL